MWASFLSGKLFVASFDYKTQFKRRSFHVPNLIPPIKYMKRSTFESISPAYLIWVDPWVKVAQKWEFPLRSDFVLKVELFMRRT